MNSLYNHGLKQTQTISNDLTQFETNLSTSPLSLQGAITTSITAFRKTIKEYGDLVSRDIYDPSYTKNEARLNKFNEDLQRFQSKFDKLKSQRESIIHENNVQDLIGRRHIHNSTTSSDNPYDPAALQQQQQTYMSYQEGMYKEKNTLVKGSEQLDRILEMGQQAFDDIVEQNEVLRKIQGKFEESLVTLGVSRGTIRSIERRAKQDKWLFWGCVVVMLVMFYYIVKFFR